MALSLLDQSRPTEHHGNDPGARPSRARPSGANLGLHARDGYLTQASTARAPEAVRRAKSSAPTSGGDLQARDLSGNLRVAD